MKSIATHLPASNKKKKKKNYNAKGREGRVGVGKKVK